MPATNQFRIGILTVLPAKTKLLLFITSTIFLVTSTTHGKVQVGLNNNNNNEQENFKTYSHDLLIRSDLDEFTVEKGASISAPFGIAYLLANVEQSSWNISLNGIPVSLRTSNDTKDEYSKLLAQLEKASPVLIIIFLSKQELHSFSLLNSN